MKSILFLTVVPFAIFITMMNNDFGFIAACLAYAVAQIGAFGALYVLYAMELTKK